MLLGVCSSSCSDWVSRSKLSSAAGSGAGRGEWRTQQRERACLQFWVDAVHQRRHGLEPLAKVGGRAAARPRSARSSARTRAWRGGRSASPAARAPAAPAPPHSAAPATPASAGGLAARVGSLQCSGRRCRAAHAAQTHKNTVTAQQACISRGCRAGKAKAHVSVCHSPFDEFVGCPMVCKQHNWFSIPFHTATGK